MQQIGELARSWSDALTALSVGSLTSFLLIAGRANPDGSFTFELAKLNSLAPFAKDFSQGVTLLYGLILLSLMMGLGYFTIQLGELISMLRDYKDKGLRFRKRLEKCAGNPALMAIFSNAYTSYRLLCGVGSALCLSGFYYVVSAILHLNATAVAVGLFAIIFGVMIIVWYARYSFASLDWTLFGDFKE